VNKIFYKSLLSLTLGETNLREFRLKSFVGDTQSRQPLFTTMTRDYQK